MRFLLKDISVGKWKIPVPVFLWFILAMIGAISEISRGHAAINNYDIYAGVFEHTIKFKNLYVAYPGEYWDTNHYGPLFSILIAPFAILNDYVGCFLWCLVNAGVLFYAIRQLPFSKEQQHIILLIGLVEMMTAIHSVQFNPMLTGWIILSFVLVEKKQDFWACLFIVAGLYIKIYGIVGIAFFWFSKNKIRFILSFLFWLVILFCLPMVISSPAFIVQSYKDWINAIVEKNAENINVKDENMMQDISILGMIRRVFQVEHLKNYFITVPAALCYALPFLRFSQFKHVHFRITYLCIAMIGVVIFSSSAESSTYVIAVTGVAIWFIIQEKQKWVNYLLGFVIILTSLSSTDLFPPYVREHWILPFSLKALPCCIAWVVMVYQLLSKDFRPAPPSPKTAI